MIHTESSEDYLERILMLQEQGHKDVRATDLALSMGYSKPSVSVALRKLEDKGLVELGPKSQLILTESGLEIAKKIYERHRILIDLLLSIGVSEEQARVDACKLEHDLSDESWEKLKAKYLTK